MTRVQRAVSCFKKGFNCSQAIFSTYGEMFGLDRELALKISCAFGGGVGRMGGTCGAVTGAFMVIGLKYAMTNVEDKPAKERTYAVVKEFARRFELRNGSIVCKELLGYDISTPEGLKVIHENHLFTTLCPKFVQDSAEILEVLLHEG